jgi:hypothetical protein
MNEKFLIRLAKTLHIANYGLHYVVFAITIFAIVLFVLSIVKNVSKIIKHKNVDWFITIFFAIVFVAAVIMLL